MGTPEGIKKARERIKKIVEAEDIPRRDQVASYDDEYEYDEGDEGDE